MQLDAEVARSLRAPAHTDSALAHTDSPPAHTDSPPVATGFQRLLQHRSPQEHAERLWRWLRDNGFVDGSVFATDLMALHADMCGQLGWLHRAWNPIACSLRKQTTGRKIYLWEGAGADRRRRLRIYALPTTSVHDDSTSVSEGNRHAA